MPEFMKAAELKAAGITYSDAHLRKLESEGKFPRRVRLGARKVAWLKTDIEFYVAAKVAESRSA